MLLEPLLTELKERIAAAITPREAAIDVLKRLQQEYGWLSDETIEQAATLLGLSPLQLDELATFYEMLYRKPVGRHVIHVCDSISCWSLGSETLLAHLSKQLGIQPGETTADGLFTLLPCCCLGNCGNAPTMMVGDRLHGDLTVAQINQLLDAYRDGC